MANNNNDRELLQLAVDLCTGYGGYFDEGGRPYFGADRDRAPGVHYESKRERLLSAVLGFECDGSHIPPEAEAITVLDGITFIVRPGVVGEEYSVCGYRRRDRRPRRKNTAKHRTFVVCPVCGRTVPMGRIEQHAVVHSIERSRIACPAA